MQERGSITSGIVELDELLGGGYPTAAVTVVHSLDAVSREKGQQYMIDRCVSPVILKRPTLYEAGMTIWNKSPKLLVLDGLVEIGQKLPTLMKVLYARPSTAVLLFADPALVGIKAVKYFCHVRIHLHESKTGIMGQLVKNAVAPYLGYTFSLTES